MRAGGLAWTSAGVSVTLRRPVSRLVRNTAVRQAHRLSINSRREQSAMRSAFAAAVVVLFSVPAGLFAQAESRYRPVNPFDDSQPSVGTGTREADNAGRPTIRASERPTRQQSTAESESRFSLPKLSMPKLPKLAMPKWKLPTLRMPSMSRRETQSTARAVRPSNEPSSWDKFNAGTKRFFAKTKDTLMPWTANQSQTAPPRPPTGTNRVRVASRTDRAAEEEKPSFFSPFLPKKEPEPRPIRSTTDFLKMPRPTY